MRRDRRLGRWQVKRGVKYGRRLVVTGPEPIDARPSRPGGRRDPGHPAGDQVP